MLRQLDEDSDNDFDDTEELHDEDVECGDVSVDGYEQRGEESSESPDNEESPDYEESPDIPPMKSPLTSPLKMYSAEVPCCGTIFQPFFLRDYSLAAPRQTQPTLQHLPQIN